MLDSEGFDLFADEYDDYVNRSDEEGTYPFAGYSSVLHEICRRIIGSSSRDVLDIGFGTGTLAAKLYDHGCAIYGQDCSKRMIELSQAKMPKAKLYLGDFSQGLSEELLKHRYDAIVATYSLHHLADGQKVAFLDMLLQQLNEGGCIYIGDIAFDTRAQLQKCRDEAGDEWDDDESYFVFEELKDHFPSAQFEPMSFCAGIISLRR